MNLEVGRAGCGLAARRGDPAGVLAGVSRAAIAQLQGEEAVFAGDLHPVGQTVVQRLVVLQPGGGHSRTTAGARLKHGLLSSCKQVNGFCFVQNQNLN